MSEHRDATAAGGETTEGAAAGRAAAGGTTTNGATAKDATANGETAAGAVAGSSMSRRQTLVVMSALMLGMLLAALDQMIVSTALPTIVGELHGLENISWVVTAYLLASTVVMPLYGKLGDLYGRRPVYIAVILIFLLGSVLCGIAQSMTQLIFFRAIQGLGGGGLMLTAIATVGDIVPPRERARYQGLFGAVFGLASIVGPLVGGFFTDHLDWRWIFYINLPLGAVALIVTLAVLRVPKPEPVVRPRVDYLGALVIGLAVACIVLYTSWGGTEYPWSSPTLINLAVAAGLLLVGFVLIERQVAEPIIPLRLFRNSTVSIAGAVGFLIGFAMFGCVAFMPLFLQIASGASATNSGLLLLPFMGGMIGTSMLSGVLISRIDSYRWSPILGTAIAAGGMVLLSTMGPDTTRLTSGAYMAILGGGLGLVMQTVVLATQNSVERQDLGTATSTVTFARQIGASFGVSIFGAIFNNRLTDELAARLPHQAGAAGGPGRPGAAGGSGGELPATSSITREVIDKLPAPLRDALVSAFSTALTDVFLYAAPVLALAFLIALWLRDVPLRGRAHMDGPSDGPPDGPAPTAAERAEGTERTARTGRGVGETVVTGS
jgi:EmrB/QacA subfamily drug resistance transporter